MPVEFIGIAATNDGSEITARSGADRPSVMVHPVNA